ncbi:MAG: zinc ribbon domain-containing protein [Gemmatimonadales bacterium]
MDDLDRLFRRLVTIMEADESHRPGTPFLVSELYQTLLPYRAFRRELEFDSIGDYEMAVLRLLAGERGYATVEPEEAREALATEAGSVNPDTAAFREYAAARVVLSEEAVRRVLNESQAYAPPAPPAPPGLEEAEELAQGAEPHEAAATGASTSPYAPPAPSAPTESEAPLPQRPVVEPHPAEGEPTTTRADRAEPDTGEPVFEAVRVTPDAGGTQKRCPDCGAELPSHRTVIFCPFCARQLATTTCRECGDEVEPGWQYCVSCGRPATGG